VALTAVHIINCLPSGLHQNKPPFEIWFGSPPSIAQLRVFGCIAYRQIPSQTRSQLEPKASKCRMIGYKEESGTRFYSLYDEDTKQVLLTRDNRIDEAACKETELPEHYTSIENVANKGLEDTEKKARDGAANQIRESRRAPREEEDEETPGEPLPPIDPDQGNTDTTTDDKIKDRLVVR